MVNPAFHNIVLLVASLLLDVARADRYAALEEEESFDYESLASTSTSSRSLYKSLGFIISWLVTIFVLRSLVLLLGKMVICMGGLYYQMKDYYFQSSTRRTVKRRGGSNRSHASLGSLSELLHLDDSSRSIYTDYSYSSDTDGGVFYDESDSVVSDGSSLISSECNSWNKRYDAQNTPRRDEEEGSYISWLGASTVSSIRSRFTNSNRNKIVEQSQSMIPKQDTMQKYAPSKSTKKDTSCNSAKQFDMKNSPSSKPTKVDYSGKDKKSTTKANQRGSVEQNRSKRSLSDDEGRHNLAVINKKTDKRAQDLHESSKKADQRVKHNVAKEGLIDQHKGNTLKRKDSQQGEKLDNVLLKQECDDISTTISSIAGSKISMVDVDL